MGMRKRWIRILFARTRSRLLKRAANLLVTGRTKMRILVEDQVEVRSGVVNTSRGKGKATSGLSLAVQVSPAVLDLGSGVRSQSPARGRSQCNSSSADHQSAKRARTNN